MSSRLRPRECGTIQLLTVDRRRGIGTKLTVLLVLALLLLLTLLVGLIRGVA